MVIYDLRTLDDSVSEFAEHGTIIELMRKWRKTSLKIKFCLISSLKTAGGHIAHIHLSYDSPFHVVENWIWLYSTTQSLMQFEMQFTHHWISLKCTHLGVYSYIQLSVYLVYYDEGRGTHENLWYKMFECVLLVAFFF